MIDQTTLSLFTRTRLNENESRVYLALLNLGTAPVSHIANLCDLKRPTVYGVLTSLQEYGYVKPVLGKKVQHFTAADPALLADELSTVTKHFHEMLPFLRALQKKNNKPSISYLQGVEGLKKAFGEIHKPENACYITSIHTMHTLVPTEVERWSNRYRKGIAKPGGRHLLTSSNVDREFGKILTAAHQEVRFLPEHAGLEIDIAIVDEKLILTTLKDDIHVMILESPIFCNSFLVLFELLWLACATTSPLPTDTATMRTPLDGY